MTDKVAMPNIATPMVGVDGRMTREWVLFFQLLITRLNSLLP